MSSNRRIFEFLLLFFGPLFGTLSWISAGRVVSASGDWTEPVWWLSLFAVTFLLAGALLRSRFFRVSFLALSFFPSVFFAPEVVQMVFVAVALVVSLSGFRNIRRDMDSRIHLSLRRSVALGTFSFSFSVALLLSGMYYFGIRPLPWADLVPKFSLAQGGGDYLLRATGAVYPDLSKLSDKGITVDSFLSDIQKKQTEQYPSPSTRLEPSPVSESVAREMALETGRRELERLVGRPVRGDEPMADVLSEALRHKTIAFLSGAQAEHGLPNGVLPFFLSALLFISVLSMASLLFLVLVPITAALVRLLVASGVLSVKKIPSEQEIIE